MNKAGKAPITLEVMATLLRTQVEALKHSYERHLVEKDSQIVELTARTRDLELKYDRLEQYSRRNSIIRIIIICDIYIAPYSARS